MSNGNNPYDDDPFASNPDAEFAPTQAMASVPVREDLQEDAAPTPAPRPTPGPAAAPGAHGAATRPMAQPGAPQPLSGRPQPIATEEKRFGISAVLSLVGGLLMIAAFLMPMMSMAWFFETALEERSSELEVIEELPDGEFDAETQARLQHLGGDLSEMSEQVALLEAVGLDDFIEELGEAKSRDDVVESFESFNTSLYGAMEVFRALDTEGEAFGADKDERAGGRIIWLSLAWIPLTGAIAVLLVLIRIFKPLNALQIGWNGLFGFMWTNAAVGMLVFNPPSKVFDVTLFQGTGVYVFAAGAVLMWVSAFAGLTSKNWWKAPLIAFGLLLVMGASILVPAFLLAG